jgi:hypothetical protein
MLSGTRPVMKVRQVTGPKANGPGPGEGERTDGDGDDDRGQESS